MQRVSVFLCLFIFLAFHPSLAQEKYFTKTGKIRFNCTGGVEKIEALNKGVTCVLDSKTGALQFAVLLKGFEFEKALMQEHFNENYVESDQYPKSNFSGIVENNGEVDYARSGTYPVKVKGKLTLHGVTRDVSASGKITIADKKVVAASEFKILLEDYGITIPSVVRDKIAKEAVVNVDCTLDILKNNP
jgi:hypothetical protein